METKKSEPLSEQHTNIVAFDYNWNLNKFYWTMVTKRSKESVIQSTTVPDISNFDTYPKRLLWTDVTKFKLHEVNQVDAIAVDWVTNNVYFGDKIGSKIKVMTHDGTKVKTLASAEHDSEVGKLIGNPRAIALYQPGWLFLYRVFVM